MPRDKLNSLTLKKLTEPGRFGDGGGLWLQVRDAQHRSWLFRYTMAGRPRAMGLGPFPDVTLAEARRAATDARNLLRRGADPIAQRQSELVARREAQQAQTFREVAARYIKAHEAGWRNGKHRYQWEATLGLANAAFGGRPVGAVDTADVTRLLEPLWTEKPETASRLRGRIESVLDYATARGWRAGENPARWRGHLAKLLPARSKVAKVQHHAALPLAQMGEFMATLRGEGGVAARALELAILTAARTSEVLNARWEEFDLAAAVWTVPGERMKAGREHRVPVAPAAVTLLTALLALRDPERGDWVFPGGRDGRPLSGMAMLMLLRRMRRRDLTVHGFRSTFRDWAAETTSHPREVAEAALAHVLSDKTEAAYRRGDLFEKRRSLMTEWAAFCTQPAVAAEDDAA